MMLYLSNREATHTDLITQLPLIKAEVLLFIVLWGLQFEGTEARLVPDHPRVLLCGSPQRDLDCCWRSATLRDTGMSFFDSALIEYSF
jgi:hypothetical protein